MATHDDAIEIPVDGQRVAGTLIAPAMLVPGVLFVHGWGGNQDQYRARARTIAALGCVCLTFDLRGHAESDAHYETVTLEQNLRDVLAAYDVLAGHRAVDKGAIAVIGYSYGGYLAAILSALRGTRWLALQSPALYRDRDWSVPKQRLDRGELEEYRNRRLRVQDNRALAACAAFVGDALIVEAERDTVIPATVIANYRAAFDNAHSLTYRIIAGADHALSEAEWQQALTTLLINWTTEMMFGARAGAAAPPFQAVSRFSEQGTGE
jgi:pimeloyl-ACP methyl ester carboxylesterase